MYGYFYFMVRLNVLDMFFTAEAFMDNLAFNESSESGLLQIAFAMNLSNRDLINSRKTDLAVKRQSRSIANSVFSRVASNNDFQLNFDLFMSHKSNLLFVNKCHVSLNMVFEQDKPKITSHDIAYFRYLDGSTIKLVDSAYYFLNPCAKCDDVQKCRCDIVGLSL